MKQVHFLYVNHKVNKNLKGTVMDKQQVVREIVLAQEQPVTHCLQEGEYDCVFEEDVLLLVNGMIQPDYHLQVYDDLDIVCIPKDCYGVGKILVKLYEKQEPTYICLKSENHIERVCLDQNNQYECCFENLVNGNYEIHVEDSFTHSFVVNGYHQEQVQISVEQNIHIVEIDKEQVGTLTVCKKRKQSDGTFITPASGQQYGFELCHEGVTQQYVLEEQNGFTMQFSHLKKGTYEIYEIEDEGFVTSYYVNHTLTNPCVVCLDYEDVNVEIVNEMKQDESSLDIYFNRYEQGFHKPQQGDKIQFVLEHEHSKKQYRLDERNNWHMHLDDLTCGEYMLYVVGSDKDYYYYHEGSFNHESITFSITSGEDAVVGIIENEEKEEKGTLCFYKRILKEDMSFQMPKDTSYSICLKNEEHEYTFNLNEENGYCYECNDVVFGEYEIMEEGNQEPYFMYNNKVITKNSHVKIDTNIREQVLILNKQ